MTLDKKVIDNSVVGFPKDISWKKAENLLAYIAKKLPGTTSHLLALHIRYAGDKGGIIPSEKFTTQEPLENQGTIFYRKNFFADITFRFIPSALIGQHHRYRSIQFKGGIGMLSRGEFNPEEKRLCDNVRKIIDEYFVDGD